MPTLTLQQSTIDDLKAALGIAGPTPAPTPAPSPAPTPAIIAFMPAPAVLGRQYMTTEAPWGRGTGYFYASGPLTDANAWLVGFTVGTADRGFVSTGEYQGPATMRSYALMRNHDGAILAQSSTPMQMPAVAFGTPTSTLDHRVQLTVGERYTLCIWNAVPNVSSRMIGQFYYS